MTTLSITHTTNGTLVEIDGDRRRVQTIPGTPMSPIDELFTADDPAALARSWFDDGEAVGDESAMESPLAPITSQEVWACGVTYLRSREARKAESSDVGGDVFYDLVYDAARPEVFFKATPHRVVGPGAGVRIRRDSTWNVPEPELTLAVSAQGRIFGHTIGNDMSSRSIEGENPLYIPQAKVYDGCAALGPRLVIGDLPGPDTEIRLRIVRRHDTVFEGASSVGQIKRPLTELAEYVFRENSFPNGAYVMTGTGIVPGDDFTLRSGDVITIEIDGIGTLENHVAAD